LDEFFVCQGSAFLLAPSCDFPEINPAFLTAAYEDSLIESCAKLPMDITRQTIFDAVCWRKKPKYSTFHENLVWRDGIFFPEFYRAAGKFQIKMRTVGVPEISGLVRFETNLL
jgi:hypothetical protein